MDPDDALADALQAADQRVAGNGTITQPQAVILALAVIDLAQQAAHYREALERIVTAGEHYDDEAWKLAREALSQSPRETP